MRTLLLALLAGCPSPPAPTPQAPTDRPAQVTVHPGEIVMRDLDAGTERTLSATTVPESIAWVTVDGVRRPVVRVDSRARPDGSREIQSFGVDGSLLSTTISRPRR